MALLLSETGSDASTNSLPRADSLVDEPGAFEVIPAPEPSLVAMLAFGALGLSTIARARATSHGEERCS